MQPTGSNLPNTEFFVPHRVPQRSAAQRAMEQLINQQINQQNSDSASDVGEQQSRDSASDAGEEQSSYSPSDAGEQQSSYSPSNAGEQQNSHSASDAGEQQSSDSRSHKRGVGSQPKQHVYTCRACNLNLAAHVLARHFKSPKHDQMVRANPTIKLDSYLCKVCKVDVQPSYIAGHNGSDTHKTACLKELRRGADQHSQFRCEAPECMQYFTTAGGLHTHVTRMHKHSSHEAGSSDSEKKSYVCGKCNKKFLNRTGLHDHSKLFCPQEAGRLLGFSRDLATETVEQAEDTEVRIEAESPDGRAAAAPTAAAERSKRRQNDDGADAPAAKRQRRAVAAPTAVAAREHDSMDLSALPPTNGPDSALPPTNGPDSWDWESLITRNFINEILGINNTMGTHNSFNS